MPRRARRPAGVTLMVGATLLGACSLNTKAAKPPAMASTEVSATVDGVRGKVIDLTQDASERVERTADTIGAQSRNRQVQQNAIQWKLVSSVEYQNTALERDPVVALAELVLFNLQSRAFLTTGQGNDLFGRQQALAVAAIDTNLEESLRYIDKVTPSGGRQRWLNALQPWADANPIKVPFVGRPSGFADSLANLFAADNSALAAVGDIELTARLLQTQVAQIQQSLLKQARWQGELLLSQVADQPVVDSAMGQLAQLNASVARLTAVAEATPDLVERERIQALLAVTKERIAVLTAITGERMAVLAAIDSQRVLVVQALHDERVATLKDAEVMSQRLIDYTLEQRLNIFINHVLLRIFIGLALLILLALGAGLILLAFARRGSRYAST